MKYNVGDNGILNINLDNLDEWNIRDFKKLLYEMDYWKYKNNYKSALDDLFTAAYKLEDSYSRMFKLSHVKRYDQIRQRMERFMQLINEKRGKLNE
jgi:hypothetical protein